MQNRFVPYGYGIANGNLLIVDTEMRIVQRIFAEYCNGSSIKTIGKELTQEGIIFYNDNYDWNKCRVSRILSDKRYLGESGYPQIIDADIFFAVNNKKAARKANKYYVPEYIEHLKNYVVCAECGKPLKRKSNTPNAPKWYFTCDKKIGITDDRIIQGIEKCVARAVSNKELLKAEHIKEYKTPTPELTKCNGEINLLLNEKQPSFPIGKQLILKSAMLKFTACREDLTVYTDIVVDEIARIESGEVVDSKFIAAAVQRVMVGNNGQITVRFINGAEIGETDDADNG